MGHWYETLTQDLGFLFSHTSPQGRRGVQTAGWVLVKMVTVAVGGHSQPLSWEALSLWGQEPVSLVLNTLFPLGQCWWERLSSQPTRPEAIMAP